MIFYLFVYAFFLLANKKISDCWHEIADVAALVGRLSHTMSFSFYKSEFNRSVQYPSFKVRIFFRENVWRCFSTVSYVR